MAFCALVHRIRINVCMHAHTHIYIYIYIHTLGCVFRSVKYRKQNCIHIALRLFFVLYWACTGWIFLFEWNFIFLKSINKIIIYFSQKCKCNVWINYFLLLRAYAIRVVYFSTIIILLCTYMYVNMYIKSHFL